MTNMITPLKFKALKIKEARSLSALPTKHIQHATQLLHQCIMQHHNHIQKLYHSVIHDHTTPYDCSAHRLDDCAMALLWENPNLRVIAYTTTLKKHQKAHQQLMKHINQMIVYLNQQPPIPAHIYHSIQQTSLFYFDLSRNIVHDLIKILSAVESMRP